MHFTNANIKFGETTGRDKLDTKDDMAKNETKNLNNLPVDMTK